ncbi:testis-expressed protein 2-like [Sycon ciliatum]|uniref:testis-expressed protein 2-like n=1 Tax=Sycon ciliatum TaxID=27933 RepID=UPI0031F6D015
MSKARRKGANAAPTGFSMRFTTHHSSGDESSDEDTITTEHDGSQKSSMVRTAPARPSTQPTTRLVAAPATSSAGPSPGASPSTRHKESVGGGDAMEDWEFVLPGEGELGDHFGTLPGTEQDSSQARGGRLSEATKRSSFYSHPKSESANTHHDLSSIHRAQTHSVSDYESRWKRRRSSAVTVQPPKTPDDESAPSIASRVSLYRLSLVATAMMFFIEYNSSSFLMGCAVGAYLMFHLGLLLVYHITKEVPHYNDYIINFEELHAAMVAHQPATSGDGVTLMQPKTILKDSFSMSHEYSGPTTFRHEQTKKVQLRLCGSQLRVSFLAVNEDISLLEVDKYLPDSCSDSSSEEDVLEGCELERRPRRSRGNSPKATILSSKSYSLLGSKVCLAPEGLNQRQRWSKKLPLHLILDSDVQFSSQEDIPGAVSKETGSEGEQEQADSHTGQRSSVNSHEFFLFAGTGRVKQDWYMRLKLAADPSLVAKNLASVPSEHKDYAKYMDFLLIHLHPTRASRFNFLRNDAIMTETEVRRMVAETAEHNASVASLGSAASYGGSVTSLTSVGSAGSSDRHDVAPGSVGSSSSMSRQTSHSSISGSVGSSKTPGSGILPDPRHSLRAGSLLWFNAALGRLFYDAWREPRWAEKLRVRWQRKLSRLKTPSYIRQLNMTELHLGNSIPLVKKFSQPRIDSRGLWIDVGISYKGNFHVTIETAVHLGPLLEEQVSTAAAPSHQPATGAAAKSHHTSSGGDDDSVSSVSMMDVRHSSQDLDALAEDEDDSLSTDSDIDSGVDDDEADVNDNAGATASATALATATSMLQSLEKSFPSLSGTISQVTTSLQAATDANGQQQPPPLDPQPAASSQVVSNTSTSATSKLKRFAGFVAHTRIGQTVMKSNVVKKLSEKVSNMPLVLSVELRQLSGTMTINVPPPPSGVVWCAFAKPPEIILVAKPRVGQREVKLEKVTDWIERKLIAEFKKRLVMPNMEDLAIPLMSSGMPDDVEESLPAPASEIVGGPSTTATAS